MRRSLMQDYGEEDEEVVEIIIVIMIKTSEWVFFFTSCYVENIEYHYLHSLDYFNVKL